jgi:hypothetical protein
LIEFEECVFCGKKGMRKGGFIKYNQSQDVFYYVNRCFKCRETFYEEIKTEDMENAESTKQICLWSQKWNEFTDRINNIKDPYDRQSATKLLFEKFLK